VVASRRAFPVAAGVAARIITLVAKAGVGAAAETCLAVTIVAVTRIIIGIEIGSEAAIGVGVGAAVGIVTGVGARAGPEAVAETAILDVAAAGVEVGVEIEAAVAEGAAAGVEVGVGVVSGVGVAEAATTKVALGTALETAIVAGVGLGNLATARAASAARAAGVRAAASRRTTPRERRGAGRKLLYWLVSYAMPCTTRLLGCARTMGATTPSASCLKSLIRMGMARSLARNSSKF
jgi:hypothetical protein